MLRWSRKNGSFFLISIRAFHTHNQARTPFPALKLSRRRCQIIGNAQLFAQKQLTSLGMGWISHNATGKLPILTSPLQ